MRKHDTLPRKQLEALHKTYSADRLTENRIRGALDIRGRLFVCTGGLHSGGKVLEVHADELVPLERWSDLTATYNMLCARADTEDGWRGGRFYQGIVVSCKGRKYVLAGREVEFTQEVGTTLTATTQRSLFDFN